MVFALAQPASAARPAVGWRMDGTGNYALAEAPVEWSPTLNVTWATPMPSWSNSSPILVGDRLFVSSEPDTLICLDAVDGRVLWQRTNPIEDALAMPSSPSPTGDVRAQLEQTQSSLREREYELSELRRLRSRTPNDEELRGRTRQLKQQSDELRQQLATLAALKPTHPSGWNGYSTPTPTSDGDSVEVLFGTGVAASYDLDGKRRWIRFVDQAQNRDGSSASPVLVGNKLLVLVNDLIALDRGTGDVVWRAELPFRWGTPVAFTIEDQDFVITPSGHCVRVADGAIVASGLGDLDFASPLIRDRVLYMIQRDARALRLPEQLTEPLEFQPLWSTRMKGQRYYSSPLLLDGLIYAINRGQIFSVLDAQTGESVYVQRLRLGWTGAADSVFTSPTQGGSYVFVSGLSGTTVVLKSGRRFEQVASNELEEFRSNPVFDGQRMYLRANDKLYCISSPATEDTGSPEASPP